MTKDQKGRLQGRPFSLLLYGHRNPEEKRGLMMTSWDYITFVGPLDLPQLPTLGAAGWELVSVVALSQPLGNARFYFKRPRAQFPIKDEG